MNSTMQPTEGNASAIGLAEGQRLRDKALDRLAAHRPYLVRLAARLIVELVLCGFQVSADDVHKRLRLPTTYRAKWIGSPFKTLAAADVIRRTGFAPSQRPVNHGRLLSVWKIADPDKARAWLRDNPELPDPPPPSLFGPEDFDDGEVEKAVDPEIPAPAVSSLLGRPDEQGASGRRLQDAEDPGPLSLEVETTRRGILIRLARIAKPISKLVLAMLADEASPPADGGSIRIQELADVCQLSTQTTLLALQALADRTQFVEFTLPGDGVVSFRIDWERIANSIDPDRLRAAMAERATMEARA